MQSETQDLRREWRGSFRLGRAILARMRFLGQRALPSYALKWGHRSTNRTWRGIDHVSRGGLCLWPGHEAGYG